MNEKHYMSPDLFYLITLMILIGTGVWRAYSHRLSVAVSHIFIWIGIFILCFIGVAVFSDSGGLRQKLASNLFPATAITTETGEIILHKAKDGHFYLDAKIEGIEVRFMVDTGASRVVLNLDDAENIGINLNDLNYNQQVSTANGLSWTAIYTIKQMAVGNTQFYDVPASVNRSDMGNSLLGMSFLKQLKSFTIEQDRLIMLP